MYSRANCAKQSKRLPLGAAFQKKSPPAFRTSPPSGRLGLSERNTSKYLPVWDFFLPLSMSINNSLKITIMSRRAQFKKFNESVDTQNSIMTLERYAQIMQAFPGEVDPKCVTLWIPERAGNRTATINLNHRVDGFNKDGYLTGVNGNCGTRYIIIMLNVEWLKDENEMILREKLHESPEMEDRLIASNIEEITAAINEIHGVA